MKILKHDDSNFSLSTQKPKQVFSSKWWKAINCKHNSIT